MAAASTLKEFLQDGGDFRLLEGLGWFLLILGAFIVLLNLLNVQVPYGRYGSNQGFLSSLLLTNVKVSARLAWFLMEMPSFAIPLYLILNVGGRHIGQVNPNIVLLGMFLLHYFNRLIINNCR